MKKSLNNDFPYELDFKIIDFRKNPEIYKVGRGEQGVLMVEPYKSEILPYWRFKTPTIAKKSSLKIYRLFLEYKKRQDFIGMDMARKFLQMGYTRSRRYANHSSGKKYENDSEDAKKDSASRKVLPQDANWEKSEKAQSARIFYEQYLKVKTDPEYVQMKEEWMRS